VRDGDDIGPSVTIPLSVLVLKYAWGISAVCAASEILSHCVRMATAPELDIPNIDFPESFRGPLSALWNSEQSSRMAVQSVFAFSRLVRLAASTSSDETNDELARATIVMAIRWAIFLSQAKGCGPRLTSAILTLSCKLLQFLEAKLRKAISAKDEGVKELASKARDLAEPVLELADTEENDIAASIAQRVVTMCDELEEGLKKKRTPRKQKQRTKRSRNAFVDANMTVEDQDTYADLEDFIECAEGTAYDRQSTGTQLDEKATKAKVKKK
jgi:hypothetical protein